jgi:hypothetical protein
MTRKLSDIAYGRSGDKGDIANISVIAKSPEAYAELKARLTAEVVAEYLGALVTGRVERFDLDNLEALNFVLYGALDGGATRSTRVDNLGKSLAGLLLSAPFAESS